MSETSNESEVPVTETTETPSETLLQKFARWIGLQVHDGVAKALAETEDVTKASFTDAEWDGAAVAANLSTEDYAKVCLLDLNEAGAEKKKGLLKLPVKATPAGSYNRNALRAAWGAVHGARTPMTGVPADVLTTTRNRLQRLMTQAGIDVSKMDGWVLETPANQLPNGDPPAPLNGNLPLSVSTIVITASSVNTTSNANDQQLAATVMPPIVIPTAIPKEEIPMADTNEYELLKSTLAEIQKANTELQARVAKAEAEAEAAAVAKAQHVWLEKANTLLAVPIPSSELAEQLYWIAKADPVRAAWWDRTLSTVDHMLIDFGTYVEKGSTRLPDYLEPVDKALQAANPREALLSLPAAAQRAYIARQNAQAKA